MLDILNESRTKIPWKVDFLFTEVVLKLKKCPKSGYWIIVHRLESCTMKASVWLQLVRRDFGMLDILNESSTKIPWKVDYLFTAVVQKLKKCPKSGYWISVHWFESCTMKASVWLQLVRRDFGMLDTLNKSSTKIPRKVDYLFTAVVLKLKKCPKSGYWVSVHWFQSCTMKASIWLQLVRRDFGMLDILNESSTKIPWKVDYLFTAVVLKMKMCPKSGYWISVHWFESCTMKASVWLQLVRRDFGMLNTLNESSTKIPRKVEYLFTAVVLTLKKCPKSGYWISVHRLESCTMKASVLLQLVCRDFGMLDILNESSTKIPRKVDYLFTAVVLKKCPKSGYWISVHRFQSCTMKASVWLQLVCRDFGMLDILNESSTKIPWKVDYLLTAVELKLKKCPKCGYWVSVHWFQSCTMKASVWLQLVRRDFGMLDILNESSTKIPWKVDYLFTAVVLKLKKCPKSGYWISVHWFLSCTMKAAVVLKLKKCPKSGYWISVHWFLSCTMKAAVVLKLKKCPKSGYWISVNWFLSCTIKASVWLQLVRRDFGMLDKLNESTKIPWKVDHLLTAVELKLKKCPKSGYWVSVHWFQSCTMKASVWLQLVRRDFGMLDILNESSTKIPWKVDYLFTAVVLKMKMCPKSGYWISVHWFESCTMKASVWLQLVRRDFGMLNTLNESSTKIPRKVEYLFTAVVLTLKKCPKSGYWISVHRLESCTMKASVLLQLVCRDFGMLDILNESSTKIPRKVDYLFTAVVLKKCPKSGYWISVHGFQSCTMKASVWLQLVCRDFGMLDILNESSTKIPWKVDYLLTAVELKLKKCPKCGFWVSVHWFQSCTMKASVWLQLVRRDFGMLDILNESSTKIPWKVDYLFTAVVLKLKKCPKSGYWISVHWFLSCTMKAAVVLKLKKCPKSGYWISVHWFLSCTMKAAAVLKLKKCPKSGYWISVNWFLSCTIKASVWLQLVRRDFGMLDKLNESTKIPWKVDHLLTAVELKLKKCPKSGYWVSVHWFQSCTMKASVWLQLVRRDFGMLDILNESSTKIPRKVDYLFTAVVLKMKMCPKSGYWISVHWFESCTMKASVWLQLVRRDFDMLDTLNESSTKIHRKVDYLFTAVVLKLKKCPISGYWISVHRLESCTMKASVWLQLVRRDFGMLDILKEIVLKSLEK